MRKLERGSHFVVLKILVALAMIGLVMGVPKNSAQAAEARRGQAGSFGWESNLSSGTGNARGSESESRSGSGQGSNQSLALSRVVDQSKYILGPGDQLTVNIWGAYDLVDWGIEVCWIIPSSGRRSPQGQDPPILSTGQLRHLA